MRRPDERDGRLGSCRSPSSDRNAPSPSLWAVAPSRFNSSARATVAAVFLSTTVAATPRPTTAPADVRATMNRMADAELAALGERSPVDWEAATFWAGLSAWSAAEPRYRAPLLAMAERHRWTPDRSARYAGFFADDECVCQTFLEQADGDAAHLAPTRAVMDALADRLSHATGPKPLTWTWCDALFMAPPAMAELSAATGDRRYRDAMAAEWWRTTALLYDGRQHLFSRDAHFLPATRPATRPARPVFWSRGNGWVIAGLARVLSAVPPDDADRPRLVQLYRDLADRLAALQGGDGLWPADLLAGGPGEASGTALDCYALAWGVNHGLLDRASFVPVVAHAWAGLQRCVRPDGLLGSVQPHGDRPAKFTPTSTAAYGVGAALLAGSELLPLAADLTPPTVSVRYVPDRFDDIAWENDRIAFRLYGPALEHQEHSSSGIDVWAKSTRDLVVNDWYRRNDYHRDHGQGLDYYEVGHSRGCGGLGVWAGGKLYPSLDWRRYTIDQAGPDRVRFTVRYDPWDAAGRRVWESRQIELDAGSNLNRMTSTIDSDAAGELTVAIGVAKRPGATVVRDAAAGLLSCFEKPTGTDGSVGTSVRVDPATIVGFAADADNELVLVRAVPGRPFTYRAGACWSKGLDIHTAAEWEAYLRRFPIGP